MTKSRSPRIWFSSLARMSWKTSSASMCYETCAQSWIRMSRRRLLAAAAAATGGGGAMWQRWDQNHYLVSCSYWVLYNYMYTKKDDPAIVHLGLTCTVPSTCRSLFIHSANISQPQKNVWQTPSSLPPLPDYSWMLTVMQHFCQFDVYFQFTPRRMTKLCHNIFMKGECSQLAQRLCLASLH